MLHTETVSNELLKIIQAVSEHEELAPFRLVGGTALSLYLGHRISVDADFFTDKSFDKKQVEAAIYSLLPGINKIGETAYGFSWVLGDVKIDFYDWKVIFIKPPHLEEKMRLASLEDIAAYKLDAVVGRKTEKDFRDMDELLKHFSLTAMIGFYREKFPFNDPRIVLDHLSWVSRLERDKGIMLLKNRSWEEVQASILNSISAYFAELQSKQEEQIRQREQKLQDIINRKNKP